MKKMKWFSFLIALTLFAGAAEARVYLDVYGKSYKKITIGVPGFKNEKIDNMTADMSDLLNKDLDFSGFFIVAPQTLIDKELSNEGVEKQEIRFGNWRSIGIELLCKGKLQEKEGELTLDAYLYDTGDGTLMLGKRFKAPSSEWRRVIHRLADDIILTVTGEKGIMSTRVVFAGGTRNHKDIYVADLDGHNLKKLTNYRSITLLPSVSPNGRYLAYTSYREGRPNLYVYDMEKGQEVYADKNEGMKIGTSWAGKSLLYSHTSGRTATIYSLDIDSKSRKAILKGDGIYTSPCLSPDGTKMVFVSDMYGGPQVFVKNLSSGETKRLTYYGNYNTAPSFSPKGDSIVFVSKFEGAFEVCVMNTDGSQQRVLTNGGINDSPQFSSDGRYIIYSTKKGSKYAINVMLYNGENKRTLRFIDGDEEQPRFMP
jgi:TolB protein